MCVLPQVLPAAKQEPLPGAVPDVDTGNLERVILPRGTAATEPWHRALGFIKRQQTSSVFLGDILKFHIFRCWQLILKTQKCQPLCGLNKTCMLTKYSLYFFETFVTGWIKPRWAETIGEAREPSGQKCGRGNLHEHVRDS